jgi:hypothetical protein
VSNTRKVILTIVVAFLVYAVFTAPGQSANAVDNIWGVIKEGFNSITAFFDALLNS